MDESGHGGIEATYWNGLLAPAGTQPAIVARLNAAVNDALGLPEVRAALLKLGSNPAGGTTEEFAAFIAAEAQRWGTVVREANIKVE
jgi:tripartite-type tricarboxylate transporter receptor subunit TctC